jgi:hypothetical protein
MIARRDLIRALDRPRAIADWVVIERVQERGAYDEARDASRRETSTRYTVILHHDVPSGRGTARLELCATDGRASDVIDQGVALAMTAIGKLWKSIPPAAPAKVEVLDPRLATGALDVAARAIVAGARVPADVTATSRVSVLRERVNVLGRSGFHADWIASSIHAETLVVAGERSLELVRESRRIADLGLADALAHAHGDLLQLAAAGKPTAGPCDLVLAPDAMLYDGALGVWTIFASQADAVVEAQGLSRFQLDAPIVPGADAMEEPIRIVSDGAFDHATRSAPVGDDGDAIRRFPLIERGICVGLGLSAREAAFRRRDPNGGVRNLVVAKGTWTDLDPTRRTVEVRRLRSITVDPYTGDASVEIGLATDHKGTAHQPFTGGTVRLDLVAALATARRSSNPLRRGPYAGPASVLIRDVDLIA